MQLQARSRGQLAVTDSTQDVKPVVINATAAKTSSISVVSDIDFRSPLTAAFIGSLVLGLLAEWLTGPYGAWLAGGLMIAYFGFGLTLPATARNTERFADSLYYLGFILTLFALLIAMTPALNGGVEPKSTQIIQQFGTAIVTTFIGMSLRIILIQLKPNVSDHEEDTRESIVKIKEHHNKLKCLDQMITIFLEEEEYEKCAELRDAKAQLEQ